jgi:hypothetical protein
MRKIGICLLVLAASFVFGSVKTYAQLDCAKPIDFQCGCGLQNRSGFFVGQGGNYFFSEQAICCSRPVPNIYMTGSGTCIDAAKITEVMHKELAQLALHNRVFLVACNGDFVSYRNSALGKQPEPTWSANRALTSNLGKLATRTR